MKIENWKIENCKGKGWHRFSIVTLFIFSLVCSNVAAVFAQSGEDFRVQLQIAGDHSAPSVPTDLAAIALSINQIEVSWNASTDNVSVAGYEIYRDNAFVATTSAILYIDSALTPGTTYSYTVRAFDQSGNYSGFAGPVSATTNSPPSGPPNPSVRTPIVESVVVNPGTAEADIAWTTNVATYSRLRWGRTPDLEGGTIADVSLSRSHGTTLAGLVPGTRYYFEIQVETPAGGIGGTGVRTFYTRSLPDTDAPLNPSNFVAAGVEEGIELSWNNPAIADFSEVRLMRSDRFFPSDTADGAVLYQGPAEYFLDTAVTPGTQYYYTLFARDLSGNYSSGVVATAVFGGSAGAPGPFDGIPEAPEVPDLIKQLLFSDFEFIQEGKVLPITADRVAISAIEPLIVRLDPKKVPTTLKTIAFTVAHPVSSEGTFTFLLRITEDRSWYEARLAPFDQNGLFSVTVAVIDYKRQLLTNIYGEIESHGAVAVQEPGKKEVSLNLWLLLLILLILLLLLFLLKRRNDEKKISDKRETNENKEI